MPRPQPAPVAPAKTQPKLPAPPEVKLPSGSKQEQWDALVKLVQDDPVCKKSVRPTKQIVVGVGDLASDVFFCGEAPGAEEEVEGEPFVGPAGLLLDKMIAATGLTRESIFIGNLMNWRPQIPTPDGQEQLGNRPPTAEEIVLRPSARFEDNGRNFPEHR